jgi:hypothetical protein
MIKYLQIFFICFVFLSCGADYDSNYAPGVCNLDCSSSKISDYQSTEIKMLGAQNITVNCSVNDGKTPYPGVVSLRFSLESERKTELLGQPLKTTPQPNISFEAVIVSGVMDSRTFPQEVNVKDKAQYKGIKTSQEEWCTDSCGVGYIELVPLCTTSTQEVNVLIHSGAVAKEVSITVKVPDSELDDVVPTPTPTPPALAPIGIPAPLVPPFVSNEI